MSYTISTEMLFMSYDEGTFINMHHMLRNLKSSIYFKKEEKFLLLKYLIFLIHSERSFLISFTSVGTSMWRTLLNLEENRINDLAVFFVNS